MLSYFYLLPLFLLASIRYRHQIFCRSWLHRERRCNFSYVVSDMCLILLRRSDGNNQRKSAICRPYYEQRQQVLTILFVRVLWSFGSTSCLFQPFRALLSSRLRGSRPSRAVACFCREILCDALLDWCDRGGHPKLTETRSTFERAQRGLRNVCLWLQLHLTNPAITS